jgi:hypothetical protein
VEQRSVIVITVVLILWGRRLRLPTTRERRKRFLPVKGLPGLHDEACVARHDSYHGREARFHRLFGDVRGHACGHGAER